MLMSCFKRQTQSKCDLISMVYLRASHSLFSRCLSILLSTDPCIKKKNTLNILFDNVYLKKNNKMSYFIKSPSLARWLCAFVAFISRVFILIVISKYFIIGWHAQVIVLLYQQFYLQRKNKQMLRIDNSILLFSIMLFPH